MRRRALALTPLTLLAACAADPRELVGQPARLVFFEDNSAEIEPQARPVLADAATLARRHPTAPVRVLGFADPEGGPTLNRALSASRAQAVATELERLGVARARIDVGARGPVPFDLVPTESRRVEVRVGPI